MSRSLATCEHSPPPIWHRIPLRAEEKRDAETEIMKTVRGRLCVLLMEHSVWRGLLSHICTLHACDATISGYVTLHIRHVTSVDIYPDFIQIFRFFLLLHSAFITRFFIQHKFHCVLEETYIVTVDGEQFFTELAVLHLHVCTGAQKGQTKDCWEPLGLPSNLQVLLLLPRSTR